ncbi:MAG: hypothetical protein IPJ61_05955 [Tessaracoccus sp.]|uniref:hypothetical protein n=1 Tax=Tessaracoccus sp. TaxID=1971211 RepID=UPI001EB3C6C7|nr:hypothetical protein [Tessaracoccus sp.]MBK7820613.1 hypothetical protein [Tessaracoccus sp.]
MKANAALQIIFAFFLGLVVVAFVGIGANTFYPSPNYPADPYDPEVWEAAHSQWALITGVVLLLCATALLAVSLFLPEHQAVLSNGILLGGVFTMIYAVGMAFSADTSLVRFGVVTVALAVTIAVGYLKFARGRPAAGPTAQDHGEVGELGERLTAVERKLDALGRALHD